MSTTHTQVPYRVAGPGRIIRQAISTTEIVELPQNGGTRSVPQGVGSSLSGRRFRDSTATELPVERTATGGDDTTKLPAFGSSLGSDVPL